MNARERKLIHDAKDLLDLMTANRDGTSESVEAAALLARALGVKPYLPDDAPRFPAYDARGRRVTVTVPGADTRCVWCGRPAAAVEGDARSFCSADCRRDYEAE